MKDKIFTGESRWGDFEAWRKTQPEPMEIMTYGCSTASDGTLELYVEYRFPRPILMAGAK